MNNPTLMVDINQWQTDFSPQVLKDNNVAGAILAFNIYTGALILQPNFINQYNKCLSVGVTVIPYMVYRPTIDAKDYINWITANLPTGAKTIFVDVEIVLTGYSKDDYAKNLSDFITLAKAKWNVVVYTGEWFLPNLSYWPDVPYWWSQYPSTFYPQTTQYWTWDQVRNKLLPYTVPYNAGEVPSGDLLIWQFSGDRIVVPSSSNKMDLNVFYGTTDELITLAGNGGSVVVPPISVNEPILVSHETWYGKIDYKKYNEIIVRPDIGTDNVDYHILKIKTEDLADIVFDAQNGRSETTWFLSHHPGVQVAINGLDGFVGDYITGFAAYHGSMRGKLGVEETLFIDQNFAFTINRPATIWNACSFPNRLIYSGVSQPTDKALSDIRARTAIGISQDNKVITVFIVDGGDYWVHHGMNFKEVIDLGMKEQCWNMVMADGGGSTTLVKLGADGLPQIVGKPSGENASGQRSVAIHMGFSLKNPETTPPTSQDAKAKLTIDGYAPVDFILNI